VKEDATGRARVVEMCQECGHDDMLDRVREAATTDSPGQARRQQEGTAP
jgi:hypothetical protein